MQKKIHNEQNIKFLYKNSAMGLKKNMCPYLHDCMCLKICIFSRMLK